MALLTNWLFGITFLAYLDLFLPLTTKFVYMFSSLTGTVKLKSRGGMSGINRKAFKYSTFPPIFLLFFKKDPGPLNYKKPFGAAKQL